jgi:hypothetical protein
VTASHNMAGTNEDAGRDVQALSCEEKITLALVVAMKRAPAADVSLLRRVGEWVCVLIELSSTATPGLFIGLYRCMRQCSECLVYRMAHGCTANRTSVQNIAVAISSIVVVNGGRIVPALQSDPATSVCCTVLYGRASPCFHGGPHCCALVLI